MEVLIQVYVAGTGPPIAALCWSFLYMVLHPDVQEKVYLEIKKQIGKNDPTNHFVLLYSFYKILWYASQYASPANDVQFSAKKTTVFS